MEFACTQFRAPARVVYAGADHLFKYAASPAFQLPGMSHVQSINDVVTADSLLPSLPASTVNAARSARPMAYSEHGEDIGALRPLPHAVAFGTPAQSVLLIEDSPHYGQIHQTSVYASPAHATRAPPAYLRSAIGPSF